MSHVLDVSTNDFQIIRKILRTYLPKSTLVFAFGSRAWGNAKKFSDLDLVLENQGNPLPREILIDLAEAFDESDLAYKVDLVDWNAIEPSFQKAIQSKRIPFIF